MVITISRQVESGGEQIAQLLCERAGLRLADRSIVERVAEHQGVEVAHVAVFDDAIPGPVEAILAEWRTSVSHGVYLRRLAQVLLALERDDNIVIIGRGAAFVLTDPGTMHVRIVAPIACRVERMAARQGLARSEAQRVIEASDEARARFVRQSFDSDIANPTHYDLTLNTAELPPEEAADIILLAARRKAEQRSLARDSGEDLVSWMLRCQRQPRLPRLSGLLWQHYGRRRPPA